MKNLFTKFLADDEGSVTVEYIVATALLAVAGMAFFSNAAPTISQGATSVSSTMATAATF